VAVAVASRVRIGIGIGIGICSGSPHNSRQHTGRILGEFVHVLTQTKEVEEPKNEQERFGWIE
jgi:hypothetical protein